MRRSVSVHKERAGFTPCDLHQYRIVPIGIPLSIETLFNDSPLNILSTHWNTVLELYLDIIHPAYTRLSRRHISDNTVLESTLRTPTSSLRRRGTRIEVPRTRRATRRACRCLPHVRNIDMPCGYTPSLVELRLQGATSLFFLRNDFTEPTVLPIVMLI